MIKVLYIVSTLKRAGPTNQLYNIIKHLDRSKFEPHLVTLSPEPADSRWEDYKSLDVNLYALGMSRLGGLFFAERRVNEIATQIEPCLIHTQGIRGDIVSSRLTASLTKLATIRNFPQLDYSMTYGKLLSTLMLWQHTNAMRNLDVCVGVSEAVSANLSDNFSVHNTATVPNGVDTAIYRAVTADEKRDLRKKLGMDDGVETWVSSGHLSERKDPLLLIESWKEVFGKDRTKQLIFVGDGPQRMECESAGAGCSNILFAGRVENVSDYLGASDYFVSASKAEGLPNAVLEALACGVPVLLSDIGPHSEVVDMATDIGLLFETGSKESLQSALSELRQKDRRVQSRSALSLIEEKLSAQVMSESYQKIYLKLVGGSAR